ncbi:MAG: 2-oxoglutarate dehydrogenase E1 component [Alphaproteobacteria bacterium]|nr:2-oxoglutarate dehydrogenase E1 component [Alphaproteobacteria bacterium]
MSKNRLPLQEFLNTSAVFGSNAIYIEEMYQRYLDAPQSVSEDWQVFFSKLKDASPQQAKRSLQGASWEPKKGDAIIGFKGTGDAQWQGFFNSLEEKKPSKDKDKSKASASEINADALRRTVAIHALINAYKEFGHLEATLDPLGLKVPSPCQELDPARYGFTEQDRGQPIQMGGELGFQIGTLDDIILALRNTYTDKIGVEFMHILSSEEREWIAERMESSRGNYSVTPEERRRVLQDLIEAEAFEQFAHVKFPGTKRFSVEGSETVIASIETILAVAAKNGIEEIAIGMAHRGRLNVLTKVTKKPYAAMFSEFQGKSAFPAELNISGDVKYHLGATCEREYEGKKIHVTLMPNPSHLETVGAVTVGRVRARQDALGIGQQSWDKAMALILHGDASFAGQGVVTETLTLSRTDAYGTGGSIHIIVNNQVGFTTNPEDARSSTYASDMAKGIQIPIFHVNGDDPDAVAHVTKLAFDYRRQFKKDVVLDVIGYRRYGHNEGDEPLFTQPIMYKSIAVHPTTAVLYAQQLAAEGVVTEQDSQTMRETFKGDLEKALKAADTYKPEAEWLNGSWKGLTGERKKRKDEKTGVDIAELKKVGKVISTKPNHITINSKIERQLEAKAKMVASGQGIDWATGEALAFGSLLQEGTPIRFTGQDVRRGTFSHRHAVLTDQDTNERYIPLNKISNKQAKLEIYDSTLSEYAVLGFEYGYSKADPKNLVLWEGQFGDFVNTAQVVIDQFIASAETKWLRLSGLVMLLPHGFEGQGPEHSSARPERFLQLCAEDNMHVVNCTTPANYFHALRRQQLRNYRKPLIVMSPKSLLRHRLAVSSMDDFITGTAFKPIISEVSDLKPAKVRKLVICSGKVYYDLYEAREKEGIKDVAIIRMEEYYPFPESQIIAELKLYKNAEVVWCQEEPKNMGAWSFVEPLLEDVLAKADAKTKRAGYVGRKASASPAVGYQKVHNEEQASLVKTALS